MTDIDAFEIKKHQIEEQKKRKTNGAISILSSMNLPMPEMGKLEDCGVVNIEDKPVSCSICNGAGLVQGLFSKAECFLCHGTGFDLSDPLKIIKWQAACMDWSKSKIRALNFECQIAKKTTAEREADSMEAYIDECRKKRWSSD